jgi:hypothetical protein
MRFIAEGNLNPCKRSPKPCKVSSMNSRRKICGMPMPAAVAIGLILVYAIIFGRPTIFVWVVKDETAHDPIAAMVPIPLPDTSISATPGQIVRFFGYQFEVPWQEPVSVKNPGDYLALAYSPSDKRSVGFFNPAHNSALVAEVRDNLKSHGVNPQAANDFLNAQSDYDLDRSILFSTPDQLSLVFPRRKEVFVAARLMIKHIRERESETGMYLFEIGNLHGFQFGNPERADMIHVDAYDDQGLKFEFIIGIKHGSAPRLTQAEINRVLQTLQPTSPLPH